MTDKVYDIEEIISHRKRPSDGKYEYFVKWKGYGSAHNTWEPKENFLSDLMIDEYHAKLNSDKLTTTNATDSAQTNVATSKTKQTVPKDSLEFEDLLTEQEIKRRGLVAEKVLNIFHVHDNEHELVAHIKFKNKKGGKFVAAPWANKNCPDLVIQFYESRIFWRDRKTGALIEGQKLKG